MTAEEAYRRVASQMSPDLIGRFYSSGDDIGLGKGKIYEGIRHPLYDPDSEKFRTVEGPIYVLTHECDVDSQNERVFNEELLICPIIRLDSLVEQYQDDLAGELLPAFLGNLGAKLVSRVVFLPSYSELLPFGGVLYLNQITHTHISSFTRGRSVCAVTVFGLQYIEYLIENHLLRPKDDRLAFAAN